MRTYSVPRCTKSKKISAKGKKVRRLYLCPSRLERILYGSALDVYLREELILQSLLGAVETTPSLWVCSEGDLLAPLKAAGKGRAIFLAPSAHAPLEAAGAVEPTGEAEVLLIQADSVSAPLRASFSPGTRPDEIKQVVTLLVEAARTMELLEPFGRIEKALLSLKEELLPIKNSALK